VDAGGGAIGAASYLSGKSGELWIAIVAVCLIVAFLLLVASPIARAVDRPMDRWLARRACDCLDGQRAGWWRRGHPAVEGGVRRLYDGDAPTAPRDSLPPVPNA
jgi:peptidoglycan/LPS O-acetylase OafA/YrhL